MDTTTKAPPRDWPGQGGPVHEDELWDVFADSEDQGAFFAAWLALQCGMIGEVAAGAVLVAQNGGDTYAPVALWPRPSTDVSALQGAAERALKERAGVVDLAEGEADVGHTHLAYPVEIGGAITALVALQLDTREDWRIREALRQLHWGIGWLEARQWQDRTADGDRRQSRAGFALDIVAVAGEQDKLDAAAMSVVNELATRLGCSRVAVALVRKGRAGDLRLIALSHTAWFRRKSDLVLDLENTMGEALDQSAMVAVPPPARSSAVSIAHEAYRDRWHLAAVASAVLMNDAGPVGVITLERRDGAPFDPDTLLDAEAAAAVVGPLLDLKRRQRRWLSGRLVDAFGKGAKAVLGPRRPSIKIAVILAVAVLAFVSVYRGAFRVSADAVLEGASQRAAVAPFQGFIAAARARAGDVVHRGDLLAALDQSDLKLDVAKWKSEYAQLEQQRRKALASLDRSQVGLITAQLEQARAQLTLATDKLARADIRAPVDGVVISGDFSQKLGSPVQQGAVLFEIAPLSDYRVVLKVDERDMRYVEKGESGLLLLSGRAEEGLPFTVATLTSVADVSEGRNVFRVEGKLDDTVTGIRPGMEGVAKVAIDSRPLLWIWTRRLIEWGQTFAWRWLP